MSNVVNFPGALVAYNKPLRVRVYDFLEEDLRHEIMDIFMDCIEEYMLKPSFGTVLEFTDRIMETVHD